MARTRIFVSHSHHDSTWCDNLSKALRTVGYYVWYDGASLPGGAAWVADIQREIQACDVFLLVLTPESWASMWVQDEVQLAIASRRRIVPLMLRTTTADGFLLTTQWVHVIGHTPQAAARAAIVAIEAPPAPGRDATHQATTETLDDLVVLCRSLVAEKRYTEALSVCQRALALDAKNIPVLGMKGDILFEVGEPKKAAESWGQLLAITPVADTAKRYLTKLQAKYPIPVSPSWSFTTETRTVGSGICSSHVDRTFDGAAYASIVGSIPRGKVIYEVLSEILRSATLAIAQDLAQRYGQQFDSIQTPVPTTNANWQDNWAYKMEKQNADDEHIARIIWLASFIRRVDVFGEALASARQAKDSDMIVYFAEGYFGWPPDKATLLDVVGLRYYRDALADKGLDGLRVEVEQLIQRLSRRP